jgi:hypothetical protein
MHGKMGARIPHETPACRYYERNPSLRRHSKRVDQELMVQARHYHDYRSRNKNVGGPTLRFYAGIEHPSGSIWSTSCTSATMAERGRRNPLLTQDGGRGSPSSAAAVLANRDLRLWLITDPIEKGKA